MKSSRVTKAGKVTREQRALHTEYFHNLHSLPNITRTITEENETAGSTKAYKVVGKRERKSETSTLQQVRASHFKCGIGGRIEFSGVISFPRRYCHHYPSHQLTTSCKDIRRTAAAQPPPVCLHRSNACTK
jgi:hypothetical protein